jgi:hypothetical protein
MIIFATLGPVACCLASYFLPDDHPHPFHEIDERAIEEGFKRRRRIENGKKVVRKPLPKDSKVKADWFRDVDVPEPKRVLRA